jgi:hypothetical protein
VPDFGHIVHELAQHVAERVISRGADAGTDTGLTLARKLLTRLLPGRDAKPAPLEKRERTYRQFRDAVISIRVLLPALLETDTRLAGTWAAPLHNSYMALLPDRFSQLTTAAVDVGLLGSLACTGAAREVAEQLERVFASYPRRPFGGLGPTSRAQKRALAQQLNALDEALMRFVEAACTDTAS